MLIGRVVLGFCVGCFLFRELFYVLSSSSVISSVRSWICFLSSALAASSLVFSFCSICRLLWHVILSMLTF